MSAIRFLSSTTSALFKPVVENFSKAKVLKVTAAVLPVFTVLQMLSNVPSADAGFACFAICMGSCAGSTLGSFAFACAGLCAGVCSTNPI